MRERKERIVVIAVDNRKTEPYFFKHSSGDWLVRFSNYIMSLLKAAVEIRSGKTLLWRF